MSFKRSGADGIMTYFAMDAAERFVNSINELTR
jgi:delta-aminolevulinic acid dehydratase/porphobilinogen synthase